MKAERDELSCTHCGARRSFIKPPLFIVTGAAGSGKSTACQRLAGTIDGVLFLDADTFADDLTSVATPQRDYVAFWRFLLRLAHEVGQNDTSVAFCGIALPEQVLANSDMLDYFSAVHFIGLVCDEEVLRTRISSRAGGASAAQRSDLHLDINRRLRLSASTVPNMTLIDATRERAAVAAAIRQAIVPDDLDDVSDEIWRPGYQGPAPVSAPIKFPPETDPVPRLPEQDPVPAAMGRPRRRPSTGTIVGIVAVVAMSATIVTLVTNSNREPADSTSAPAVERFALPDVVATDGVPFAGADPRRLPGTLDPIWSQSVPAAEGDDVWVEVIDRRSVLVAIGPDQTMPTGSSVLQSLDAETGITRWSTDFAVAPDSLAFVAANADSIAVIIDGTLTGIDAATGASVWTFGGTAAIIESNVERLVGTDILAIGSPDGTSTLVDMTTGDTVGQLDGPTIATDQLGQFYVRRDDDIVRYDLGNGFSSPTMVAAGLGDPVVAVVGRRVITSGPEGWTASIAADERLGLERGVLDGSEDFPTAAAILPMVGTTFVVAGAGVIVGADLDGGDIRFAWKRDGTVTAMYPTERGFLVHAASRGGAAQTIYDGRNGNAVVTLTVTAGLFDSLVVAGNGVLTKKTDPDGPRLAGLDLDGNEMWAIRDVTAASVGDRLIVTTTRLDDGSVRLDAVGDLPTP